jgi:hypothetical protein
MVAFTVPNMVGLYNDAYATGRGQARDRGVQNALGMASTNPTGAQNELMRFGAVEEAGQLGQMQERQQKAQGAARSRQLLTAGNRTGAMEEAVFSGNTELMQGLKSLDDARLEQFDRLTQKTGGLAYNLKAFTDPAERAQRGTAIIQSMVQQGDMTPEQGQASIAKGFDDATLDSYVSEALGLKGAIDNERQEREFRVGREDRQQDVTFRGEQFEEAKRSNRVGESFEGARLNLARQSEARQAAQAARDQPDGMTPQQARQQSMAIRKEFNSLPDVKAFNDVATSYDVISALAKAPPSAANDPGSVVREGEFANAQNAAGIPDRIRNAYNKAANGQMLNPNQRVQFTQGASNVYTARRGRYDQLAQEYQGYAGEVGLDGERLIQPRPAPPPPPTAPARQTQQRGGLIGQVFGRQPAATQGQGWKVLGVE